MIFRYLIILLSVFGSLSAADFDDFDILRYYPLKPKISGENYAIKSNYFKAIFLHSNPYGIEDLNWNYISARYNREKISAELLYRSTGFKKYYRRDRYRITAGYNLYGDFNLVQALEIRHEDFGDFGSYTGSSIDMSAVYLRSKYSATFGFAEISLKKPYDKPGNNKSRPFAAGSVIFDKGAELTIGVRRFESGRVRWIFDQTIIVTRNMRMNFGYQNKPSNIRGGLELVIEGFSILLNYNSIGGLDDSVIWGISFEK